jgi:ankyrin repeat protein
MLVPDYKDSGYSQRTPADVSGIHLCAYFGLGVLILHLLEVSKEADSRDSLGRTPLSYAAERGHETIVRLLLARKDVAIDSKDAEYGWTSLFWAAVHGYTAIVRLLLDKGADIDAKSFWGHTALHMAILQLQGDVVKVLLKSGADVRARAGSGFSPLHMAVSVHWKDMVQQLINKGADVEAKADIGCKPLRIALAVGDQTMEELLVSRGAQPLDPTEKGDTSQSSWILWNMIFISAESQNKISRRTKDGED